MSAHEPVAPPVNAFSLDGVDVPFTPGETILQAARRAVNVRGGSRAASARHRAPHRHFDDVRRPGAHDALCVRAVAGEMA